MRRIDFLRSSGRWFILLILMAAGGFLFASRRVSFRNYCAANADCAACGLKGVCNPPEKNKLRSDEEK